MGTAGRGGWANGRWANGRLLGEVGDGATRVSASDLLTPPLFRWTKATA
jgi:hypothetical protein